MCQTPAQSARGSGNHCAKCSCGPDSLEYFECKHGGKVKRKPLGPVLLTHLRSCFRPALEPVPTAAGASVRGPRPQGRLFCSSALNPSQQRARAGAVPFLGAFSELGMARSQEQGSRALCHQQLPQSPECALASSSCPSCPELSPPFHPVLQSPWPCRALHPDSVAQECWEPGRQLVWCWLCPSLPGSYLTSSRTPSSHLGRVLQLWIPYL